MINKLKKILILMLFIIPFGVNAENEVEANMVLNCDKVKLSPGATTTCSLKVNVIKGSIYDIDTRIALSNNLSLDGEIEIATGMMGDGEENRITIQPSSGDAVTGLIDVASFKIKASNSITGGSNESIGVTSTDVTYDLNNGYTKQLDNVTKELRIVSNVNTLSSLTLSTGTLSPKFSSDTTNYTANIDAEKVTINATKSDNSSTLSGDVGEVGLKYGVNTFNINVASESGVTKVYTISLTRPDNRSTSNDITSFEFFDYTLNFSSDNTQYSLSVENDVTSLALCMGQGYDGKLCINDDKFHYTGKSNVKILNDNEIQYPEDLSDVTINCENSFCTYVTADNEIIGEYDEKNDIGWVKMGDLNIGSNILRIDVIAENETIKKYTFNINRKGNVIADGEGNISDDNMEELPDPNDIKTGSLSLYIVFGIIIVSIFVGIFCYNKFQKNQGVT